MTCHSGQAERQQSRRDFQLFTGPEKCWGRISSCLLNSLLGNCVCFSETSCQKPLLTAPLASHDSVMSRAGEEKEN